MIEIRSAAPFCPVLTTCPPERVDTMLAALGVDRERVILMPPARCEEVESLRGELSDERSNVSALRDELRGAESRNHDLRAEFFRVKAALAEATSARDEARATIRGIISAYGADPEAVLARLSQPATTAPEEPQAVTEAA